MSKFPYKWTLKDAVFTKDKGTVFSCFSCGGGSTMGYKLAGFDVIGCNEIDPRMMKCYIENHHPKYSYLEDIRAFKNRTDLPPELYNLDILDGSPPCSTFSIAGSREDSWGKSKVFREGQSEQILDTLFFDFIDLADKLKPKVVVAENVKGLILGSAKDYVVRIYDALDKAGYYCQHFLLNSATMGVPQRRERVFFVALRKDLSIPFLSAVNLFELKPLIDMKFVESYISFGKVADYSGREIKSDTVLKRWNNRQYGDSDQACFSERMYGKRIGFNQQYVYLDKVCPSLIGKEDSLIHYEKPYYLGRSEVCSISTFPQDFDYCKQKPHYVCGMSVPPVMMAQIATRIYSNWLSIINNKNTITL